MAITKRIRIYELLEAGRPNDPLSRFVDGALIVLIAVNVIAVILESVPSFSAAFGPQFRAFEVFSVAVFTVEYGIRVWSCVEIQDGRYEASLRGRLRYMLTPLALIDLVAILPFYLAMFFSIDLRFLRVLRLLRVFKLTRYSAAMTVLLEVLRQEARSFGAVLFILCVVLIMASSGIYLLEHKLQPEAFGSIPAAMWWAVATLTTVGYGDVTPITPMGKVFGALITIVGIGMVALPAGILASGFSDQLRKRRDAYLKQCDDALGDGIVTESEATELRELRESLGLSDQEAEEIYDAVARRIRAPLSACPHCGRELATGEQVPRA